MYPVMLCRIDFDLIKRGSYFLLTKCVSPKLGGSGYMWWFRGVPGYSIPFQFSAPPFIG